MRLLGASLSRVAAGRVQIELPVRPEFTQQSGFVHAGILATIVDSAGGYAAYTLMPKGSDVLTVEFKLNFLAPCRGEKIVGEGRVVRAGRTLSVCELRVESVSGNRRELCAIGTQTLYCARPEVLDRRTSR
ncbi:MAG TPA: PaaI family thioesterase [Candidatus Thermoplasmatota archaeon]|nr:PaaI family thioesterase [Candidatus Thermoplasmatota archaeon]